ncbi:hypothetical protein CUJ83_10680 [Methanocella sp. CWC-04]|uniref:DUF2117 domain-containing protein n=1 Tax=Methanooceanicella nereidis TaxID=2052831 RepID=A0AAP2RDU2_9EURY|nr:hypothetical protein [Methanocella sp. CWC-04]
MVVHGPAPVYSKEAKNIIDLLSSIGNVSAVAGGTMCRTAIIDEGLRDVIDISSCDPPSIALLSFRDADALVVINHGKTLESGINFGEIVAGRVNNVKSIIHAERIFEADGTVIIWGNDEDDRIASEVASVIAGHFKSRIRQIKPKYVPAVEIEGFNYRKISGVLPGEPLFVGGTFVGTVVGREVRIKAKRGLICGIEGVKIKDSGLAKIGPVDLDNVMIKSGWLRDDITFPRIMTVKEGPGKAVMIDHTAFLSMDTVKPDTVCAITVGDDTTEVACDILARLGIRAIGITDGDKDSILKDTVVPKGSVIIRVSGITDDEAGVDAYSCVAGNNDTFEGFSQKVISFLEGRKISYTITRY